MHVFTRLTALTGLALALASSPAFAGACPKGKEGVDVTPPGPQTNSGKSDTVLTSIDISSKFKDATGAKFRLRRLVIQPGGVVAWHSHAERPANIYIVEGAITEYNSGCSVPIEHKAGDAIAEFGANSHWWKNNTDKPVTLISSDIIAPKIDPSHM